MSGNVIEVETLDQNGTVDISDTYVVDIADPALALTHVSQKVATASNERAKHVRGIPNSVLKNWGCPPGGHKLIQTKF